MNISEMRTQLDKKEKTIEELFEEAQTLAKESQEELNSFVTIMEEMKYTPNSSILNGIPYSLKDNFSTKGILTTGSSNILKDYVPVFDSTVYKKLKNAGAVLLGKTVLDELAMGGSGLTGHTGIVKNPWDTTRIAGGSSSGSAVSVSEGIVPFSIGSDTGDSVRKPASYCGIVGFKPTYGRISRFGLFPFASSLDHVGIFARNVFDVSAVTDILKGFDELDMTTLPNENINYIDTLENDIKGKKLFYIKEIIESATTEESKEIIKLYKEQIEKLKESGLEIEGLSFNEQILKSLFPVYFISEMIKRRFIIGSYILERENQEKLFINAKRVRRMVVEKMNKLFEQYDGLILPASGCIAPEIDKESEPDRLGSDYLMLENHLVIGNFGGYPSITLPCGYVNNMPVGINLTCAAQKDALCLNLAYKIEEIIGIKDVCAGGNKNV